MKTFITILLFILCFLVSCARTSEPETSRWIIALETLKPIEGFHRAGIFTINGKIYVQNCDPEGNQIWLRYNENKHTWRQSRYNSQGCSDGDNATGPYSE